MRLQAIAPSRAALPPESSMASIALLIEVAVTGLLSKGHGAHRIIDFRNA